MELLAAPSAPRRRTPRRSTGWRAQLRPRDEVWPSSSPRLSQGCQERDQILLLAIRQILAKSMPAIFDPAEHIRIVGLDEVVRRLGDVERVARLELGQHSPQALAQLAASLGTQNVLVLGLEPVRVAQHEDDVLEHVLVTQAVELQGRRTLRDLDAQAGF